jgi:hypothetical protein
MKILILLENLTLNPAENYAVNESTMKKIQKWLDAGATVEYLTGINKFLELKKIDDKFHELDLPDAKVHKKQETEKFKEVLESVSPGVFIDLKGSADGEKSISQQLGKGKIPTVELQTTEEILKLPDYPEEIKKYIEDTEKVEEAE